MPLIGLKDDDDKYFIFEDIFKGKGNFSDPHPLLMAVANERVKTCDFSVTELMDDPYVLQLKRRFEYFTTIDEMMDMLLGTAFHALMEKHSVGTAGKSEVYFSRTFEKNGRTYVVGGTCDYIEEGNEVMWDYKTITMGKLKMMLKPGSDGYEKYQQQLDYYAALSGLPIKALRVRLIVRDWRFYEYRKENFDLGRYPRGGVIEFEPTPADEVFKQMEERLDLHIYAENLSDDELYKAGKCDTWGGIRCNNYCSMKSVCHFHQSGFPKGAVTETL